MRGYLGDVDGDIVHSTSCEGLTWGFGWRHSYVGVNLGVWMET